MELANALWYVPRFNFGLGLGVGGGMDGLVIIDRLASSGRVRWQGLEL